MTDTPAGTEKYLQGQEFYAVKQFARAFEAFRAAADEGHPAALMRLGYMYRYGIAVKQDIRQAAVLFEDAIAKGDVYAKGYLGNLLMHGSSGRFLGNISHPHQVWRGVRLITSGLVDAFRGR